MISPTVFIVFGVVWGAVVVVSIAFFAAALRAEYLEDRARNDHAARMAALARLAADEQRVVALGEARARRARDRRRSGDVA